MGAVAGARSAGFGQQALTGRGAPAPLGLLVALASPAFRLASLPFHAAELDIGSTVDRHQKLPVVQFLRDYVAANKPVVLTSESLACRQQSKQHEGAGEMKEWQAGAAAGLVASLLPLHMSLRLPAG